MRRGLLLGLIAMMFLAGPANAQVSEVDLAPFVGSYTDAPGHDRRTIYVTSESGMIARWHYGTGCHIDPKPPCDPPGPFGFLTPGGLATAALWRREGDQLIGTVLSTNQASYLEAAPVRITLIAPDVIEVRQGERAMTFERVKR